MLQLTKPELDQLKCKQVQFVVDGLFRSVEHSGFVVLLQTSVDLGASMGSLMSQNVCLKGMLYLVKLVQWLTNLRINLKNRAEAN